MSDLGTQQSVNFDFLSTHSPQLVKLGAQAERYLHEDPNTCLIKLRQYAEILTQRVAANLGMYASPDETFKDLLDRLRFGNTLPSDVASLFHGLRMAGNKAAHELRGTYDEAHHQLRMARALAVWFHQAFGKDPAFKPQPFVLPPDPRLREREVAEQLAQLLLDREHLLKAATEAKDQFEAERQRAAQEMAALQAKAAQSAPAEIQKRIDQGQKAATHLELSEADTRHLIDQQLRDAGWEADSQALHHAMGARPQKGKNLAIAEWPTKDGKADYVLFAGLQPMAVVEAKRKAKDVSGSIEQAKRYSRGFAPTIGVTLTGGPWGEYQIPFLFATNGRPYLRQIATKSGVWFLDARRPQNHACALEAWYTPQGLQQLFAQDIDKANEALAQEPFNYLPLRYYQEEAIRSVESGIGDGRRELLVAMATGTGKTITSIGMVYRLIKARRFRRILFLVDRSALGEQTANAFKDVRLENHQSFTDIYDVKELGDIRPESDTRLHITTVQGLVKRVLYAADNAAPLSVDAYDCIIVDECHRGYNLDKELGDDEVGFRSEEDYISKYRRVLDHFDAFKIGLTATPALHTTDIFGAPVYQYSYRQAVVDGYLVDYEPPIRINTQLSVGGIAYKVGEKMAVYDAGTNLVEEEILPDEVTFEVETFNKKVITENFNRVVCEALARDIDPSLPGKTLIFCATDGHADLVVSLLKQAMDEAHGGVDDDAILKITGNTDKPLELIRHFKNERNPRIVTTVDLLTTGIDVPEITNLVFLRRVKSRILYEQMVGRATRLCPDIDKETFRIFDAVDLYAALEPYTSMKPVVTQPGLSFEKLAQELQQITNTKVRQTVHDQFVAKLQRKARKLQDDEGFETLAGMSVEAFLGEIRHSTPVETAQWLADHADFALYLDRVGTGGASRVVISHHEDALHSIERGYGKGERPADYLEGFKAFVQDHMNLIPALKVVVTRPRELTRKQLKELKLELDKAGYTETALRRAYQDVTNQDIAASIIGHIRQRALGSPLVPYAERVDRAVKRILEGRLWTAPQRQWLDRIAKQLKQEIIVDREAMDQGAFKSNGGFVRLNKVFDGNLEGLLSEIQDEVWKDAG